MNLYLYFTEGVHKSCDGEGKEYLEYLCNKLPDDACIGGPEDVKRECEEDEFNCGNGQCIHGLGICDGKYQCRNGADELEW